MIIVDQFGGTQVVVLHAKYFCTPAQKEVNGGFGGIWPIEDPLVHLACYQVENLESTWGRIKALYRNWSGLVARERRADEDITVVSLFLPCRDEASAGFSLF